ncbi:hypothetical protein ACFLZZ_04390 [Nanoarchaeota archaeon]
MAIKTQRKPRMIEEIIKRSEVVDDPVDRFKETLREIYRFNKNGTLKKALIKAGDLSAEYAFDKKEENTEKRWKKRTVTKNFNIGGGKFSKFTFDKDDEKRIECGYPFLTCALYDIIGRDSNINEFLNSYFSPKALTDPVVMGSFYTGKYSNNPGLVMTFLAAGDIGKYHSRRVAKGLRKLRKNEKRMEAIESPDSIIEDAERLEHYGKTGEMCDREELLTMASLPVILPLIRKSSGFYEDFRELENYKPKKNGDAASRVDHLIKEGYNQRYVLPIAIELAKHPRLGSSRDSDKPSKLGFK